MTTVLRSSSTVALVERDQMHSPGNDTGPGSQRVVYVGTLDL